MRSVNEDSILALPDQRIWVVSDGMGGHTAGDFASQAVVEAVASVPREIARGRSDAGGTGGHPPAHA